MLPSGSPLLEMSAHPALLALLGFTTFERDSFESFFALGREQGPGYELTPDLWRAECVVANADDEEAVARLMHAGLLQRSVLLGSTPHAGAALQLPRPINLLLVMRALDTLVGARPRAAKGAKGLASSSDNPPARRAVVGSSPDAIFTTLSGTNQAAPVPAKHPARASGSENQVQRVLDELAFRTATLPPNLDARAFAAEGAPGAAAASGASGASGASAARRGRPALERIDHGLARTQREVLPMEHILVIDNDAATLRMVAVQLQRFGFQMHLAGHPDDALRLLTSRFHDYVFMDPALPGLDALLVCRLAKQGSPPDERPATTVVLLADPEASATPLERALPAADACLRKPLEQRALLKLMGEREVARVAYADTARTTTLI